MVTLAQLHDIGLSTSAVAKRAKRGLLMRMHPGVFWVGVGSPPFEASVAAALAASSPGAAATGLTAARLYRASRFSHEEVDVVRESSVGRRLAGVRVRRSCSLARSELRRIGGLAVVSPARMLVDLARDLTAHQLCWTIDELAFRNRLDRGELERSMRRRANAAGHDRLRAAVRMFDAGSAGSRSYLEDDVLDGLRSAGAPEPKVNMRIIVGVEDPEIDVAWPEHGVFVDIRGPAHLRPSRRVRDANLERLVEGLGQTLVRIWWEDIDAGIMRVVEELVAAGADLRPAAW